MVRVEVHSSVNEVGADRIAQTWEYLTRVPQPKVRHRLSPTVAREYYSLYAELLKDIDHQQLSWICVLSEPGTHSIRIIEESDL